MNPETLALTVFFGLTGLFVLLDAVRPARALPPLPGWRVRGTVSFVVAFFVSSFAPLLWDGWLAQFQVFDLSALGIVGAAAVGFLVYQSLLYAWHRTMHRNHTLWRIFHQMHHSAERHDVYGAFYFHPVDVVGFSLVGSLALVVVAGVPVESALIVAGLANALALFQHANLRTPRWLGYFVVRPESHMVHHQRGLHAFNYCDFPLIDMVMGTFRNPAKFEGKTGFYDGASARVGEMLIARDVSMPSTSDADHDSGIHPALAA